MKKLFITIIASVLLCSSFGQLPVQDPYQNYPASATNINQYQLYIDSVSNSNQQTQTFAAATVNINNGLSVNLTGTVSGVHQLYVKVIDATGKPSIFVIGNFYMEGDNPYQNTALTASNINRYSFYIDSITGANEQVKTFTASNTNTIAPTPLSLTGVITGVHQLYAKVINANGNPSIFNVGTFYMEGDNLYQNIPPAAASFNKYSFYIDSVTNINEQPVSFAATNNNTVAPPPISLATVASGVHQLYTKVTDINGKPSIINVGNFYMEGDNLYQNLPPPPVAINRYEFYVDSVSIINAQPINFAPTANNITPNATIDLTAVLPGVHYLFAKLFDINNKPSIVNLGSFLMEQIFRYQNAAIAIPPIANMEYFLDTDPGYGLAIPIAVNGVNTNEQLSNLVVNFPNGFPAGVHYFHIRSKQNPWSMDNVVPFSTTSVVPLTWQFVKAQLVNNTTLVSWATAQEMNTSKFFIEHSEDGITFTKVGEVAAAGNSSTITNYNFTHFKPAIGINFYRIKQIDIDARFTYSEIVKVINRNSLTKTIIAPNPVTNVVNVVEANSSFIKSIQIFDNKGALLINKIVNAEIQVYSLPVVNLQKGNYILKVNYANETKSFSLVK